MKLSNEELKQNLASYVEANAQTNAAEYKISRELNLARYTLEQHAEEAAAHLTNLRRLTTQIQASPESARTLAIQYDALQKRAAEICVGVTEHARKVAAIAKNAAEIESLLSSRLDAVQIYSIIAQLPTLILNLLNSVLYSYFQERNLSIVNGTVLRLEEVIPEAANVVASALNEELERSVNVLTYRQSSAAQSGGVIESQVISMLSTVPLQPQQATVVEPTSKEAETIQRLNDTTQ